MSFWNVNGTNALETQTTGSFEASTGFDPIPDNTKLLAVIEEASYTKDKEFGTENEYDIVSLRWKVLEGEFKNRVIFQKVHCLEASNPAKREKAVQMLIAIDYNAGGKLASLGRDPVEMDFAQCLTMKPMIMRVRVWETEDKSKNGNWVDAVWSRSANQATPVAQKPAQQVQQQVQQTTPADMNFDEDIGF